MSEKRILVVEDDPVLNSFFCDVLKRRGFSVTSADNGKFAIEEMEKSSFDLIVSDMKMDEMDGLQLLESVKKIAPLTNVIIITAFGTVKTAVEAIKMGAFDYLTKPIELDEFNILIDRVFAHQKLLSENRYLKKKLRTKTAISKIIGRGPKTERIRELIQMVAPLDATVLIQGETGTGKEVIANAIHEASGRKDGPFVKVNCAALPDTLLESELFGHEKGAFTGATQRKAGRFELADGGTLLLDEIGELGIQVQAKLLRAIQHQQFDRVGSGESVHVDVRLIATTNRDLKEEVKNGGFRKDLFFRLNVVNILLDPIRNRREDIPFFINHFLHHFNAKYKMSKKIDDTAMNQLLDYDWPGNVRELENCIETALILNQDDVLTVDHFHFLEEHRDLLDDDVGINADITIAEAEKQLIVKTYRKLNENKTHTARQLGITIKTLRSKLKEYGLIGDSEDKK